jgi:outer membrane biosynthesis protein TonB
VFISAASHVVLVALALLGTPKLFDNPELATIEVDLVRPDEAELKEKLPEEKPAEKPKEQEKPPSFDPFAPQAAEQAPQAAAKKPEPPPKPPAPTQQALGPQIPSPAPTPPPQPSTPWIFDPANIPALMNMPAAPERGFDAESTTTANLTNDERVAFKAHLKRCWKLPEGMTPAQTTRVVLRVFLKADGRLSADPLLIEASASRDGPLLLKAAIRTLKECQPYAFLPAEKYRDWKVLDLSFSPRDMAGG